MLFSSAQCNFDGFGPCSIRRRRSPVFDSTVLPVDRLAARKVVRQSCPQLPGVYGMVDRDGVLIYVGKSKSLRNRLLSYFAPESEDAKATRIIARTERLYWEPTTHEFLALLRELDLIRRFSPRFNVQGQPGRRRFAYVCVGRKPAPYLYVAPEPSKRTDAVYGPLRGTQRLRDAVRRLNDSLGLRDCPEHVPMVFAEQLTLFGQSLTPQCLRYEMDRCLGPCAGMTNSAGYSQRVRAARRFLSGANQAVLTRYETEMRVAAENRQFERAAGLRDAWADLAWLDEQLERLRWFRSRHAFVYELQTCDKRRKWYLFYGGRVRGAVDAPTTDRRKFRCLRALERVYFSTNANQMSPPREDLEAILVAATWFRRNPSELERTMSPDQARELSNGSP
jgi:excinuclease ABC subunit C